METSVVIHLWQVIFYIVSFAGSYTVIVYMTKRNTRDIEVNKEHYVKELESLKEHFVSLELYKNEIQHVNATLAEIKRQNAQIITMLTSKTNKE